MIELVIRLVGSLAVIVGLVLLMVRAGGRKLRPRRDALVRVVHRQALSRTSAVAVVEVGRRFLVLGTTEHQINVLAELDAAEVSLPVTHDQPRSDLRPDVRRDLPSEVVDLDEARSALVALSDESQEPVRVTRAPGSHAARPAPARPAARPAADGPLVGSVLSLTTWRQALVAATGRA